MGMLNPAEQADVLPNGMIQPGLSPVLQYPAVSPAQLPSGGMFPGTTPAGGSVNAAPAPVDLNALRTRVGTQLNRMLMFRRPYDPIRLKWFKQYIQVRDQKMFPDNVTPRSNTFVPYAESNVETVVSRTYDAFFAVRPFFECTARASQSPQAADNMQIIMEYKLHRAKISQKMEEFVRNCSIYGHSALKVDWDWGYEILNYAQQTPVMRPAIDAYGEQVVGMDGQPVMVPLQDPRMNLPDGTPNPNFNKPVYRTTMQTKQVQRKCPKFWAIDPYDLLVDPDGGMVAQLVEKNFGDMKKEAANYKVQRNEELYRQEALDTIATRLSMVADPDTVIIRFAEFWNETDNTVTQITFLEDRDALSFKDQRYALRTGNSYTPYKRQYYGGEQVVLYHGPNPFAHRRCPIVMTSYVKLTNEPMGRGVVEIGSDLNEALNTMVNSIRDNWNVGINSRYAFNTDMDLDYDALTQLNVPGGLVGVSGDVNMALKPIETFKPNSSDYMILPLFREQIEQATGISDFYQKGVGTGGANNTASGINTIVNESNYRFRMFIRNVEMDIVQPLLEMTASNIQQFMTDAEEVMITDTPPAIPKMSSPVQGADPVSIVISPEDIIGSYSFDLVAANYATNEVVRQRNMMALASQFEQNPYINKYEGTKLMLKTFKIPEWSRLLVPEQQVQQDQQAQAAQQWQTQMQQREQEMMMQLEFEKAQMFQQMQLMEFEHKLALEKAAAGIKIKTSSELVKQANKHNLNINKDKKVPLKPTGPVAPVGRPRNRFMPEGKMPGAGNTSPMRDVGQSTGLNAMGLEGLGETGGQ